MEIWYVSEVQLFTINPNLFYTNCIFPLSQELDIVMVVFSKRMKKWMIELFSFRISYLLREVGMLGK